MTQPTGDPGSGGSPGPDPSPPPAPPAQTYPPASWGSVPAPVGTAPAATEGSAIVALVCAVLSWIAIPVVLAVVALLVARSAERAIVSSGGLKSGLGLVSAAKWVAWINLLVCAMVVAFIAAFIVAVAIGR